MRYTTYSKFNGTLFDALNIQDLLEGLADFLLQSGFAGGPQYHPWWGWTGEEGGDRSLDALKQALLQALIESGQLTPEMVKELRGEGQPSEKTREKIAALLDELVRRMVEEGYLQLQAPPQMPGSYQEMPGRARSTKRARRSRSSSTSRRRASTSSATARSSICFPRPASRASAVTTRRTSPPVWKRIPHRSSTSSAIRSTSTSPRRSRTR